MVLSTSQQVALAFTAVLFTFVVLPKMFGVGTGAKESRLDPRYSRKGGPGPGTLRVPVSDKVPPNSHQSAESMLQMKKLMEQELKGDKLKSNNNSKGYVFTLMPLYAIGVGVFAAYKFLKIKASDDQAQKDTFAKGAKKSAEAENQLNELEQRLAQTERMLNSILTQLDPLTNCTKSVAQEQKNEIMTQLQTIRYLMKKRGMDCPPLNEACFEQSLDNLIETLGAGETPPASDTNADKTSEKPQDVAEGGGVKKPNLEEEEVERKDDDDMEETEEAEKDEEEEEEEEEEEGYEEFDFMPSHDNTKCKESGKVQQPCGLRRRNLPE
ncbi:resistance to inhibitors of cholinesterase protein 3 isoform X2 [Syngnathus scovelli]|uniref:resistance to inhibitors of cholinesterase protein 3 isoform X2 n=1 Tax=Syngnathus scovelli TaxID=161590 RepID=UPI00210F281C|nr:coiled-coil domain-containing protein 107 isoform X2 [Syngnathus scovelli]